MSAGIGARPASDVVDVVDYHQVEPAVGVVIDEAGRCTPGGIVQASLLGDVGERAVAVVPEQPDSAVFGEEDIGPAVVVDVADRHPHAVAGDVEARTRAHVGEAPIRSLAKEPVGRARMGTTVLQKVDVEPTIVIEIKKSRS